MDGVIARGWVSVENQAPIIKGINDDPDALRIMQRAIKRVGAENHYFFCGRDIVAYRAFNVPIETAWQTLNESQKGLSGVETHARLSITHYKGKTEVNAVTNEPIPGRSPGPRTASSSSSSCATPRTRPRSRQGLHRRRATPTRFGSTTTRTA